MSIIEKSVPGRSPKVKCDGCGKISNDKDGYYFDRKLQRGGYIFSRGRECQHDFCINLAQGESQWTIKLPATPAES